MVGLSIHISFSVPSKHESKSYSFEATATIPLKTRKAPRTKSVVGISLNNAMPSKVAPMGSRRAKVAVSKDFRFERDE